MSIFVIGLNHSTADVDTRERIAFNGDKLEKGLSGILSLPKMNEAIILSTCNRVEVYITTADEKETPEKMKYFLSQFHSIERERLDNSLYVYKDLEGVHHLFRVASSLDSMVVGEPQILGQLKEAFDFALSKQTTGIILNKLMKKAISVAKRIRTETKIAENAVSISYAAVELAKKIFADLDEKIFMLLGAGEMAELAARHLMNCGVKEVIVSNRTYERGCALAEDFQGRPVRFEKFKDELIHADIVICSTGAPEYILCKNEMHSIMKERKQKPVFLIDISVPRNIDPDINHIENVYLYDIDDLQSVVGANLNERQKEALKAEEIIQEEVKGFQEWLLSLEAVPTIVALRKMAENIKKEEITKLFHKLDNISDSDKKEIEHMANAIMNKLIHPPTVALKENNDERDVLIAVIKRLFGINGEYD